MRTEWLSIALLTAAAFPDCLLAQSLWDRRDPSTAHLFYDMRAHQVGDIITIVINENTGANAQETRQMEKQTSSSAKGSATGSSSKLANVLSSFAAALDLETASDRIFNGTANTTIARNFTDALAVVVVCVQPNGNIVIEGYRRRLIAREMRTLTIRGIVRPADIGPYNTVDAQFIANLQIGYTGRGTESAYMNQGWGGRIFNWLWPF